MPTFQTPESTVLTCSTGTDPLDVAELTRRGVTVVSTPTYCSEEVADHARPRRAPDYAV